VANLQMVGIPDFSAVIADRMLWGNNPSIHYWLFAVAETILRKFFEPGISVSLSGEVFLSGNQRFIHVAGDVDVYTSTHAVAAVFINA